MNTSGSAMFKILMVTARKCHGVGLDYLVDFNAICANPFTSMLEIKYAIQCEGANRVY